MGIAHFAIEFGFGNEGRDRVDDDDVDAVGFDEDIGDFEGLLAVIGLRDEQVINIDAETSRIAHVEGVFGIDKGSYAAVFLSLGNGVNGQGGLTGTFRTKNLDDAAFGITAHAKCSVEGKATGGYHLHVFHLLVAEFHDGAFTKVLFDFCHSGLQRFQFFAGGYGLYYFVLRFCHIFCL